MHCILTTAKADASKGLVTVREQDILPMAEGQVASLPVDAAARGRAIGQQDTVTSIAIGNYANDHHYPGVNFPLQPKSIRWGGRWTGTPFTIPYGCLVPASTDGLLVCEKNISVSHIANGSTRLQPVVMNIGQAAGMAAALCVILECQPRDLPVRRIQEALLQDSVAPAAIVPLFNLPSNHPRLAVLATLLLDNPGNYPITGNVSFQTLKAEGDARSVANAALSNQSSNRPSGNAYAEQSASLQPTTLVQSSTFSGIFQRHSEQDYTITLQEPVAHAGQTCLLITLQSEVDEQLKSCLEQQRLTVRGRINQSGNWLVVEKIELA
jgi:hypothetical protein